MSVSLHRLTQWALGGWPTSPILITERLVFLGNRIGGPNLDPRKVFPVPIEIVDARRSNVTCFVRIGFWIFNRLLTDNRHRQYSDTVGSEHSANFLDCFSVFANVLKDVGGKDKVISRIFKGKVPQIYLMIYPLFKQIGSLVAAKSFREHWTEELFGGDVEHNSAAIYTFEGVCQH